LGDRCQTTSPSGGCTEQLLLGVVSERGARLRFGGQFLLRVARALHYCPLLLLLLLLPLLPLLLLLLVVRPQHGVGGWQLELNSVSHLPFNSPRDAIVQQWLKDDFTKFLTADAAVGEQPRRSTGLHAAIAPTCMHVA